MDALNRFVYFFTPYTDGNERAVARFFNNLTENRNRQRTLDRLALLLQRNIAVINLWSEFRYKGYRYLRKSARKKLYANLQLIAEDFDQFYRSRVLPDDALKAQLQYVIPGISTVPPHMALIRAIMDYLSPVRGKYSYVASSSFGRLLRDPAYETLEGDCNQVVTLYIFLYSRYQEVRDLMIRQLPGHVALHYGGVDIETTNGTFVDCSHQKEATLVPLSEIVSINLLDTSDAYLATHEISAGDLLQASRLAFILSHDREVVRHNLEAAYGKAVNVFMERHNFAEALELAKSSHNIALLNVVGHNAAVFEIEHHRFVSARRYASYALKKDELIRASWEAEGAYYFQTHRYRDAITAFNHNNDSVNVRHCYAALFLEEQTKLGKKLTAESIKNYAALVRRMQEYANKSGEKQLLEYAHSLSKYL